MAAQTAAAVESELNTWQKLLFTFWKGSCWITQVKKYAINTGHWL